MLLPQYHRIVALESQIQPLPEHGFTSFTNSLISYPTTSTVDQLHARIQHATIIITTTVRISAATLDPAITPNLRYIAISATGTDPVDLDAARARGIRVTNCPAANLDTVSEHALSLYFAARRRTVLLDRVTRGQPSEWKKEGSVTKYMRLPDGAPPLTCREEVVGIVGYGGLGKRIAHLARALGMKVLIADRKPTSTDNPVPPNPNSNPNPDPNPTTNDSENEPRTPFETVLSHSTVLILSLPRLPSTHHLISHPELSSMHPHALLINIARGGIVDESAVVAALQEKKIAGYATDVYDVEPVGGEEDSPLLSEDAKDLNITLSPHLAWFSQRTWSNLGGILKETVEAWARGEERNVVV